MRRPPPSWALLVVAAALLTIAGTIMKSVEIDNQAAWLVIGAALILIGQWSAIEIYHSLKNRITDKDEQ